MSAAVDYKATLGGTAVVSKTMTMSVFLYLSSRLLILAESCRRNPYYGTPTCKGPLRGLGFTV